LDAIRFDGTNLSAVRDWLLGIIPEGRVVEVAAPGDWIVRDEQGGIRPMKVVSFQAAYQPAPPEAGPE